MVFLQITGGDSDGGVGPVSDMASEASESGCTVAVGNVCDLRDLVRILLDFRSASQAMPHQPPD